MRQSCPYCGTQPKTKEGPIIMVGPFLFHCTICLSWGWNPDGKHKLYYWGRTWLEIEKLMAEDGKKL